MHRTGSTPGSGLGTSAAGSGILYACMCTCNHTDICIPQTLMRMQCPDLTNIHMYMTNWWMLVKGHEKNSLEFKKCRDSKPKVQTSGTRGHEHTDKCTGTCFSATIITALSVWHQKNKQTVFKDWIRKHSLTRRLHFMQGGEGEKIHSAATAL